MTEIDDIRNRDSLEALLKETGQSRENCVMLAHRAAMRVAPLIWDNLAPVREDARLTALPICRPLLISGGAALVSTPKIRAAAAAAARAAAADAADAARAATAAARAARAAARAARVAVADAVFDAVGSDCSLLQTKGHIPSETPLWGDEPPQFSGRWGRVVTHWREAGGAWDFWVEWYEGALAGKPLDIVMLTEIALISPEIWDGDEDVLNARIVDIYQKYQLREEVVRLRAEIEQLSASIASIQHRSHNMPPELISLPAEFRYANEVIEQGLAEAQEELALEKPDKGRLERIARTILDALKTIMAYCAGLADTVLQSAAKSAGVALWAAGAAYVLQPEPVRNFARRLLEYALNAIQ